MTFRSPAPGRSHLVLACLLVASCLAARALDAQKAVAKQAQETTRRATPLDTALAMARSDFRSWVYKKKGKKKSIDCTEFVLAVTKRFAASKRRSLTREQCRTLTIATVTLAELEALVDAGDPKIRGVQTALVRAGLGRAIPTQQGKAGDLIQYWYPTKRGWRGHAGLLEGVTHDRKKKTMTLHVFGSHRSTLRKRADGQKIDTKLGGIGSGPRLTIPADPKKPSRYKIYLVRWTAPARTSKKEKSTSKPEGKR